MPDTRLPPPTRSPTAPPTAMRATAATLAETIRVDLADQIVHGRLAPGLPLEEIDLAKRYGVSRTPVREALRQLEAMGLAEARPRRGAVVAKIDAQRLNEMFSVMAELEALCAKAAAQAMDVGERAALDAVHARAANYASSNDLAGYAAANTDFHDLIYAGSHNRFLADLTANVRQRVAPFRRAQFESAGRLMASYAEHDRIVRAIRAGDGTAAAEAMAAHIGTVRVSFDGIAVRIGHDEPAPMFPSGS